jgi:hypothetical protein
MFDLGTSILDAFLGGCVLEFEVLLWEVFNA